MKRGILILDCPGLWQLLRVPTSRSTAGRGALPGACSQLVLLIATGRFAGRGRSSPNVATMPVAAGGVAAALHQHCCRGRISIGVT